MEQKNLYLKNFLIYNVNGKATGECLHTIGLYVAVVKGGLPKLTLSQELPNRSGASLYVSP